VQEVIVSRIRVMISLLPLVGVTSEVSSLIAELFKFCLGACSSMKVISLGITVLLPLILEILLRASIASWRLPCYRSHAGQSGINIIMVLPRKPSAVVARIRGNQFLLK